MTFRTTLGFMSLLLLSSGASALINVAPSGTASQSSTAYDGPAELAIDGNTSGIYWDRSVTSTDRELQPWWQVVLTEAVPVHQIVVWNRTDCCADRLADYTVSLWRQGAQVASGFHAGVSPVSSSFSFADMVADTVRVQLSGNNWLSLAEVQVFATPVPEPRSLLLMLGGLGLLAAIGRPRSGTGLGARILRPSAH